jgi:hypothetical protein
MYVVLRVTTEYAFDHIFGLFQPYQTKMNMFVNEKEMQSLNTKTRLCSKPFAGVEERLL